VSIAEVSAMYAIVRNSIYISLLMAALPALAASGTAGVALPETYTLNGQSLVLNGAGIRSKFFFKIYVGALYLATATDDAANALAEPGAKSMQMVTLYKEVSADKIAEGWRNGFEANLSPGDLGRMRARLQRFNSMFPALHKGDHVYMDFVPGEGTRVTINRDLRGSIEGDDFFAALLQVWIGPHPADKDLKRGLLGD